MTTAQLIEWYANTGGEEAFSRLVAAHLDLVYSSALRQVRDPATAQDVTQLVFITLARQAGKLRPTMPLEAWLLGVTRNIASDVRRGRARRTHHEQEAVAMKSAGADQTASQEWESIAPHLDDALADLRALDRQLIVLRFMRNLPLRDVGAAVGMSENSAGKRIVRVLEKLRTVLARRGVTLPGAVIGAFLASHGIMRAPAALAGSITKGALVAAKVGTVQGSGGWIMAGSVKMKIAAAIAVAAFLGMAGTLAAVWHFMGPREVAPATLIAAAAPVKTPAANENAGIDPDELAGRVLDESGNPIKDAKVSFPLNRTDFPDRIAPTTTSDGGVFRFSHFSDN